MASVVDSSWSRTDDRSGPSASVGEAAAYDEAVATASAASPTMEAAAVASRVRVSVGASGGTNIFFGAWVS